MSIIDHSPPATRPGADWLAEPAFEVQDIVSDGRHRLVLTGELDLAPAAELERMLLRLCTSGTRQIAIDLSKLSFIGSVGIRLVLLARRLSAEHGCEFMLIAGPTNVQRTFELSGLADVLPFQPAGSQFAQP